MSYIYLSEGIPDFTKTVISLWFRVPQTTIAAAAYDPEKPAYPFNGIVPFVVMGKKGTLILNDGGDTHPTFIGAFCQAGEGDEPAKAKAYLVANFETTVEGTVTGDPPDDESHATCSFSGGEQHELKGDKWHHVLISVELKEMASHGWEFDETITEEPVNTEHIESASRLYIALDDDNKNGNELSGQHPFDNPDLQAVVSDDCSRIANSIQEFERPADPHEPDFATGPVPHYSATDLTVPCSGQPIGFPATPEFVKNIHKVEMAEFQMWTGVMLDTGVITNRRYFVDGEGKPVDPKVAERLLVASATGGKQPLGRPAILLHGSNNWIEGFNTGTTGIDEDGELKPGGQFKRVGGIEPYKPDPSLEAEEETA